MKVLNALGVSLIATLLIAAAIVWTTRTNDRQVPVVVPEVLPTTPVAAPPPVDPGSATAAERLGDAFASVAAHVRPSVVSVYSERVTRLDLPELVDPFDDDMLRRFFGERFGGPRLPDADRREYRRRGMGSGMVLDVRGHVLTNAHVVRDVDQIKVTLSDKRTFEAKVVGTDPKTDVAVLRLEGPIPDDLPVVTLGDSDALHVGQLVLAIGAPFGLTQTVTSGIISATGRSGIGVADYEDMLQTDAAINPGNSGGPLVNMRGEVIGMNSAIASAVGQYAGVGFAIPSTMIKKLLGRLTRGEKIVRGQLGVMIQDVTKDLAEEFGVAAPIGSLVSEVTEGGPAARAGLEVGDIVTRFGAETIRDGRHFRTLVADTAPGTRVELGLVRDGKALTVTVQLGEQGGEPVAEARVASRGRLDPLGIGIQTLTPALAKQFGVTATKGVVVTDVDVRGLAAMAGVRAGDIIVEINRSPVATADELRKALTTAAAERSVLLRIQRRNVSLFVVIRW